MTTKIHFIDVGQGNMVLIEAANGEKFVFDCNITGGNESRVLNYVAAQIGVGTQLEAFICSHRDADHMRGVKKLHKYFPIKKIWDSDYPGTTTTSQEYIEYMALRRLVGHEIKKKQTYHDYGRSRFNYLSGKDDRLPRNANAQGIVIKVEHHINVEGAGCLSSAMLPGDSDAETWRYAIMKDYSAAEVSSDILMAAHHGSNSFFDDPADTKHYYVEHMQAINPALTIISVGADNPHGHPKPEALKHYEKYSTGGNTGKKIYRTDENGTMVLTLKDEGGWALSPER